MLQINKNNLWLLDAHCDAFEMRNFLRHDFDLTKKRYLLSPEIKHFLSKTFKAKLSVNDYHVTLKRLTKGIVKALFLNVSDFDYLAGSKMIDAAYSLVNKYPKKIVICCDAKEIKQAVKNDKIAIILVAEGPLVFQGKVHLLRNWHRLGIQVVNLSHGEGAEGLTKDAQIIYKHQSSLASTCAWQISTSYEKIISFRERNQLYKKQKGLSQIGKTMLNEMEQLGMICDLSHANDAAFWEALENTNVKVCATHSNCASLCNHTRNLTNDMMRALAKRNGVMGLCFYGNFIDENKPTLNRFIEHVLHALSIMGENHVGIGTDFDGVEPGVFMAIPHPGRMNELWEALDKVGINLKIMKKIAHENFLQLMA
jgi:membrane dipeptidase